ncbi:MAG: rhamnulose-1-phosphate aldolase [Bacteroidota bacterium]|nr:rhamnulose-1-phosphate aldolase [Bacteroidota bacterium]
MNITDQTPELKSIINEVAEIAGYLWQRGWAEKNAGNISININHLVDKDLFDNKNLPVFDLEVAMPRLEGQIYFITGTGSRMRDIANKPLRHSVFIRIMNNGQSYKLRFEGSGAEEKIMPTSELPTHLALHNQILLNNGSEKVILHTHASELIAFTHSASINTQEQVNRVVWGMHPEAMVFIPAGVGFVPYALPGSQEIADKTIEKMQDYDVVLWEKHGIFAKGETIGDTFDKIDIVTKSVKIWFMCHSAGFKPEGLTDSQIDELKELVAKFGIV